MSMAFNVGRDTAPCQPNCADHGPMPVRPEGGRCAYFSPGRPGQICGRESVAVYVSDTAAIRCTYRCSVHDREVNRAEAERQGFRRMPVGEAA